MLNQQERGNKAQFIVDAVMFYVNSGGVRDAQHPDTAPLDETQVEAIVRRVLQNTQAVNAEVKSALHPIAHPAVSPVGVPASDEPPADGIFNQRRKSWYRASYDTKLYFVKF